jgi:hypothetical protein
MSHPTLGPDRPIYLPRPGKTRLALGRPPAVADPTSIFLDETGSVYLGYESHSDLMLFEDSE